MFHPNIRGATVVYNALIKPHFNTFHREVAKWEDKVGIRRDSARLDPNTMDFSQFDIADI